MRKVITTSIYQDLTRKNTFFEEWHWFKFNDLGQAQGTNLKSHISLKKGLRLKVRMFGGLNPTFVDITREKMVEGPFYPLHPHAE